MNYVPRHNVFVENTQYILGRYTILDLFGTFSIGDAMITLSWENLLDGGYMTTPVYPMPGREFRLGVQWHFVD
jgi:outer membrane cobalamin receptor